MKNRHPILATRGLTVALGMLLLWLCAVPLAAAQTDRRLRQRGRSPAEVMASSSTK